MPDSDPTSSNSLSAPYEPRHLPVPVPPPRENSENWFTRTFRALFGWKPTSIRSDLKDVLDAMTPGESGFSPEESRMLKNILGLRERRVGDVMIPRADIIDVQQGASQTGRASSQVLSAAKSLSSENNRLKSEVEKFLGTVRAG